MILDLAKSFRVPPVLGWCVFVVLIGASAWQLGGFDSTSDAVDIDVSDPAAVAGNCLGELEMAETLYQAPAVAKEEDFRDACLPPLALEQGEHWITVTSPSAETYGFRVARLNRATYAFEMD